MPSLKCAQRLYETVVWVFVPVFVLGVGVWPVIGETTTDARTVVGAQIESSTTLERGERLFPEGTVVDRAEAVDGIGYIDVTIPADAAWDISPIDIEGLNESVGVPLAGEMADGGTVVRVRHGANGEYLPIGDYVVRSVVSNETTGVADDFTPGALTTDLATAELRGLGGPTVNASPQPAGALSGVTVYTSAGHGWTAGSSSWYLQRGSDVLRMNEDYANIDQLNYFVHYLFNAGATVVPFRPVGYQPIEIVIDNADAEVAYSGTWYPNSTASKYYGNSSTQRYRYAYTEATETHVARYTPNITVTGFYPVYCWVLASSNRVPQTYRIKHSGGTSEVVVDHREVGNGWVWLGEYYLEAGGENYVEISNKSDVSGVVIADAIRWGCGIGDVSRPGPGSISGYPRDEEASRYWAESELGSGANGFSSSIWDLSGYDDGSDNVGTAARWAAEMNQVPSGGVQVDRWKRVYLEFHTNAAGCGSIPCGARGSVGLIHQSRATTNQASLAAIVSEELDHDMVVQEDEFEHDWSDNRTTYTASFGAISTNNNDNEFDATIIEVAFHDNQTDAELLRDCRVRAAVARTQVQGIIRFLNSLSGSQVPLAFAPDVPQSVQAVSNSDGTVTLSWEAPLVDDARGDPATGYVIYESSNGYGFGSPTVLGNVLTATIAGPAVGEVRYYRVAATNAGGESMPSEVLAVRRVESDSPRVLIVNGFDRLRRQQNYIMTFTHPSAYAGDTNERQMWRKTNSYDYVIQHAKALANGADVGFDSCANEAVINYGISMGDYDMVVWIAGEESVEDEALASTEQNRLADFLEDGGALFISGAEVGYALDNQGGGQSFYEDTLGMNFSSDDAGTYEVSGDGLFGLVGDFDFDPANGAPYDSDTPDVINAQAGGEPVLVYSTGTTAGAIFEHAGGLYRVVNFGFPFETITSESVQADLMGRIVSYLDGTIGPLPFDKDRNGYVDDYDYMWMAFCMQGPAYTFIEGNVCLEEDGDGDGDVDLNDFSMFQQVYTGSPQE